MRAGALLLDPLQLFLVLLLCVKSAKGMYQELRARAFIPADFQELPRLVPSVAEDVQMRFGLVEVCVLKRRPHAAIELKAVCM